MAADMTLDPPAISARGRYLVLAAAFLGWMFAGLQMAIMNLATPAVTRDFDRQGYFAQPAGSVLPAAELTSASGPPAFSADAERTLKTRVGNWFAWFNSAFLFGAATGGLVFGWMGDRTGRVKALGLSIFWYSLFAGAGYFVQSPEQLLVLRFLSAMGVGGMWPTGVSLVAEAWSDVSRPLLAGLIGDFGQLWDRGVGCHCHGIPGHGGPLALDDAGRRLPDRAEPVRLAFCSGIATLARGTSCARHRRQRCAGLSGIPAPFVEAHHAGHLLGNDSPLGRMGGLRLAHSLVRRRGCQGTTRVGRQRPETPLAEQSQQKAADARVKAITSITRAGGGALGSLLGGWLASLLGRRTTYFLISLSSFAISQYIYRFLSPLDAPFQYWVFTLGFISTVFFGWLPLYLPELFPTTARATGTGVAFNFGRIATAAGVLGAGALMSYYHGDYAKVGQITSLIYGCGMLIILFAPDTTRKRMDS